MIVACSACSTRFRVADEKVGPRGARVKCSRCGHTFSVAPPPAPEPAHVPTEPTGTGGWPTGVLEVAGASGSDPVSSIGLALETDPFAAFATRPPPPGHPPSAPGKVQGAEDYFGSLPVTSLSDLEGTAAKHVAPSRPPGFDEAAEDGLALEERTPSATPAREAAARWSDPEASQAIEIGPDGFQEVDLARGEARPDPEFDSITGEGAVEAPVPPPPRPVEAVREAAPPASPAPVAGPDSPAAPPSTEPTSAVRIPPARSRALAMNVLSLAALLLVTLGIVMWWRGEGIGAVLRWPRGGHADLDLGAITSGVYEGSHGHPVVFVRGVVRATHEPVEGPVTVRVFLERGGAVLGAAMATAGSVPSAEDLAEVKSPEELRSLQQRLASRAPLRIEPGGDLPFLAVLPVPAGDVGGVRFRVELVPARGH